MTRLSRKTQCFHSAGYRLPLICALLGAILPSPGCDNDTRTIRVRTQPSGASVYIDGEFAGGAPCEVQWKDARPDDLWELHVIEARARNYDPQRKEIRYRTGEAWLPEQVELTLTPTNSLVTQVEESTPEPEETPTTWTPKKEIPTANNTPPKRQDPPQADPEPVDSPSPSFSIWRPKGGKRDMTSEPSPSPSPAPTTQPVQRETEQAVSPDTTTPAKLVTLAPGSSDMREFTTSGPNRLLACEVRLVRLSDGRVLSQASLQGPYSQREEMMDVLVKLLAKEAPDDANVAVGCLSNRRRSTAGRTLCDEMTRAMDRSVRRTPGLRYVRQVNLRDVILDEQMVESPRIVADRRIAYLFTGADHVIVGGAAMAAPIAPPVEEP
jgi:hypothetical protein